MSNEKANSIENLGSDEISKRSIPKLFRILIYAVCLVALTFVGIVISTGRVPTRALFREFFSAPLPSIMADEYHFDVGRNRVFADLGGAVAAAGSTGIQVLDSYGDEILRYSFRMTYPAISAENGTAIAFDIGGTALRVFNDTETLVSLDTVGSIVSASINANGWFVVASQEGIGTRGVVSVYDAGGMEVFQFFSWEGYPLAAEVSPDNRSVAILRLTEFGSQIVFFDLNSIYPESTFDLPGEIILDIRYVSGGNVLAVSTHSLHRFNINGVSDVIFDFSGRRLGRYSLEDGLIALHLLDFGVGYSGSLITLDRNGQILGEIYSDRELISMSYSSDYLAVLWSDGPAFFNAELELIPYIDQPLPISGADQFIVLSGRTALAAGEHSAVVVRGY